MKKVSLFLPACWHSMGLLPWSVSHNIVERIKNLKICFHKHLNAVVQYVNMVKRGRNYGSKLGSNQSQAANVSICFESFKLARALLCKFLTLRKKRSVWRTASGARFPAGRIKQKGKVFLMLARLHAVALIALRKRPTAA